MNGIEWYFKYFLLYQFFFHYSQMFYDYILLIKKNMRLFSYSHTPRKLVLVVFYFFFCCCSYPPRMLLLLVDRSKRRGEGPDLPDGHHHTLKFAFIAFQLSLSLSYHISDTRYFYFFSLFD